MLIFWVNRIMLITTFGAHILWQALMWEFYLHWLILNNPVRDILLTYTSGQWIPKGTRIWNQAGRNTKINELPVFLSNATCTCTVGHADIWDYYDNRLASAMEMLKRHLKAFFFSSSYFSCKPLPSCNPSRHWDRKAASTESTIETMVSGLHCSEAAESLETSENK